MGADLTRALIESIVRRTLRNLKDDPERSIRNLIDMALNFSEGRFQRDFFETAQEMLRNERSGYYGLIRDMAATVEHDRLLTFGMDVGYNSCTLGAKTIREIEARDHYNIPWAVAMEIDGKQFQERSCAYREVIRQGKELGIYTWALISAGLPDAFIDLARAYPDCAFAVFCTGGEITEALLDEAESLHNLLFAVRYDEAVSEACALLRRKGYLYAVHVPYRKEDWDHLAVDEVLCEMETLHPLLTMFSPKEHYAEETRIAVYEQILGARKAQSYQTIPLDLVSDSRRIDGVISDDACEIFFDRTGRMHTASTDSKIGNKSV